MGRTWGLFILMHEISLKAEELFHIGSLNVTNALFLAVITMLIFVIWAVYFNKKISLVPKGFQNFFEIIFEGALELMETVLGSRKSAEKYAPLVITIFLFVMTSNWLGLTPFVGSIGIEHVEHGHHAFTPLLRAPAADLNFTVFIAMLSVVLANLFGFIALGFKRHASKFFNFKNPIMTFVGFLELVSEFVKIVSFSFRLFGNIFAGEVLLLVVGFLVPYFIPLPFLFLEVFVGFIQAFIFAMLTLVFIAMATSEEGAH